MTPPTPAGSVGQRERLTQNRVLRLFQDLGYTYLGNLIDRIDNAPIREDLLTAWLHRRGVAPALVDRALHQLRAAAAVGSGTSLYDANQKVYSLLRYGVKARPDFHEHHATVWLVDWENPAANDFAVAEEVTIHGEATKRPDVVLYLNGIAVAVLELKRSTVAVSEGIRQNLDNQRRDFIRAFFATVHLIMAGNDTEGLRYGVIETPEKYYLGWKEEGDPTAPALNLLDRNLTDLCQPARLLEVIHDFTVFDAGTKKTCRPNQYFGVKAAQRCVLARNGGIIWHTQGSGKSLTMVWLAKWLRERQTDARVLIITDRTELDEQIEKVFVGVDEQIQRTTSAAQLIGMLNATTPALICTLIHKFGHAGDSALDDFVAELESLRRVGFHAKGNLFVFVDECHRTQSGKLHRAMKTLLPDAVFIGFTGTPLLRQDKQTSIETFGPYIHTYKYDEAVRDGVVLDLRYEARDIDQRLVSPDKVDLWFESNTRGLSELARAELRRRWGTMQEVLSSRDRLQQIVNDVLLDMETRDRLMSGHGNALLVCSSIYQACKVFDMFSHTPLAGKCAIVTSYTPAAAAITGEESGEGETERQFQYQTYRRMLADHFGLPEDQAVTRVEEFERVVKDRFVKEPGQMKLLIVVDKLLTGFDAPPATYLYIDKPMRDHGLFQAICRVNRLDGDDKEYGYIVDYKDLFKSLTTAVHDYTAEALDGYDKEDVAGLLTNRVTQGRTHLDEAIETYRALVEPVPPPYDTQAFLHYFCAADTTDASALADNEPKRVALYKTVAALLRAYAALANDMAAAGYSADQAAAILREVERAETVRREVKIAAADYLDMKMFEPAMRHLLDVYIRAEDSRVLDAFDDLGLVQMIVEHGLGALGKLPSGLRGGGAMAETIENNIRRLILDEQAVNPKYFERMSQLLGELIRARKEHALEYEAYLHRIRDLAQQVVAPGTVGNDYPPSLDTGAKRALYDNLDRDEDLALAIDAAVRNARLDDWRATRPKRMQVLNAIRHTLDDRGLALDPQPIFDLVDQQRDY